METKHDTDQNVKAQLKLSIKLFQTHHVYKHLVGQCLDEFRNMVNRAQSLDGIIDFPMTDCGACLEVSIMFIVYDEFSVLQITSVHWNIRKENCF